MLRSRLLLAAALVAAALTPIGCVNAEAQKTALKARRSFQKFRDFSKPRSLDKEAVAEWDAIALEVDGALADHIGSYDDGAAAKTGENAKR